ncbi:MAG: nucleoside-diphosphate kinase [Methermicoccaceae archaeon]
MEQTFVMIKPDGVSRGLIGEAILRIERKGLKLVGMKMVMLDGKLAAEHYAEHTSKPFFASLVRFITSGPVLCMVVEGKDAVAAMRMLCGKTDPVEADAGTVRGDFALDIGRNIVHASDSLASAQREISIHFTPSELVQYERCDECWLYE